MIPVPRSKAIAIVLVACVFAAFSPSPCWARDDTGRFGRLLRRDFKLLRNCPWRLRETRCQARTPRSTSRYSLAELGVHLESRSKLFRDVVMSAEQMLLDDAVKYHHATLKLDYEKRIFYFENPHIEQYPIEYGSSELLTLADLVNFELKSLLLRTYALGQPKELQVNMIADCNRLDEFIDRVAQRVPINENEGAQKTLDEIYSLLHGPYVSMEKYMAKIGFEPPRVAVASTRNVSIIFADQTFEVLITSPHEWYLAIIQNRDPFATLHPVHEGNTVLWGKFYYAIKDKANSRYVGSAPARISILAEGIYIFEPSASVRFIPR